MRLNFRRVQFYRRKIEFRVRLNFRGVSIPILLRENMVSGEAEFSRGLNSDSESEVIQVWSCDLSLRSQSPITEFRPCIQLEVIAVAKAAAI